MALNGAGATYPTAGTIGDHVVNDPNWTFSGAYASSSATPGRVTGNSAQVVNGVAPGATANFMVIGWSANIGNTVGALNNFLQTLWLPSGDYGPGVYAYIGESRVGTLTVGDGTSIVTPTVLSGEIIPGFLLGAYAPEPGPDPTTLALAGLGALAWLGRRRKQV